MASLTLNVTEALPPRSPEIELLALSQDKIAEQREPNERWFLKLSYRGAGFCGWQRQPNAPSVQQTLEEALHTVLRRPVAITGAGRTDTGVNARVMWAHFDAFPGEFKPESLLKALNQLCGRNIAVEALRKVKPDAHARFDAVSRTYRYVVIFHKNPFLQGLAWRCFSQLDMEAMNRSAEILTETDDFTSFAKLHSDARTNICNVTEARWDTLANDREVRWPEDGLIFTITADRFLRNMVRAVVGTLVDVGRGKLTQENFISVIEKRDRCAAGQSMPPEALYLWDIKYPESIWADNRIYRITNGRERENS